MSADQAAAAGVLVEPGEAFLLVRLESWDELYAHRELLGRKVSAVIELANRYEQNGAAELFAGDAAAAIRRRVNAPERSWPWQSDFRRRGDDPGV